MKKWEVFSLRTVRKKLLMVSKLAGIALVFSYIVSARLPLDSDTAFLLWFLFVVGLMLMIDFIMGRFISKPIAQLHQAAERMANLDFSLSCHVTSADEFGELSKHLNTMAENLQQALSGLEAANIRLEKEVEQERYLLAERKELIDNLSHEMKTPLGVIRAYAEGMQDEADVEKQQKYAAVIISETERLSDMITTLLDLSALENGAVQLASVRFDFVELVETVAGRLLIDAPDADFVFQYDLPEHKVFVQLDKGRMEQVLCNLFINAKKNTCPQGILKISLVEHKGELQVSIYNQGTPIPEEKLPKIWEKFYRDSNVSYRGSGLGLAIVAQILEMQNIAYGVKNCLEGVVFYFSIPIVM